MQTERGLWMSTELDGSADGSTIATRYRRDGFVFPIDVITLEDSRKIRADLEEAETELADDPERLGLLRSYPDRLLPSFDALIRNERLVSAASAVLGSDLLVWSASLGTARDSTALPP